MAGELLRGVTHWLSELVGRSDEWLNAMSDGLRAIHERDDLRPRAYPDRLETWQSALSWASPVGGTGVTSSNGGELRDHR